jgi:hypothetical protein
MVDNEAISASKTPISQSAVGDLSKSTEPSVWELFRQAAKKHPIATALAGLCLGTAIATLLGLPVWYAWEFLLITLLIVAICGVLVAYLWSKSKTSSLNHPVQGEMTQQATASQKGFWHSWCERPVNYILSRGLSWRVSYPRTWEFHDGKVEAVG